jgi:glycosyltransferase involved in cell wall biosynthesis
MKPLLSLCIPTFKRLEYLEKTVESITCQDEFIHSGQVELIISDNGSNDGTESYLRELCEMYPDKIIINNFDTNQGPFLNFLKAFSLAKGEFLKLNNDTQLHNPGSLRFMLDKLMEFKEEKNTIILFSHLKQHESLVSKYDNLDSLMKDFSFWITWAVPFGLRREQFNLVRHLFESEDLDFFRHVRVAFNLVIQYSQLVRICAKEDIYRPVEAKGKGGYDLVDAFVVEYLNLIADLYDQGLITHTTLKNERRNLIFGHTYPYIWNCKRNPEEFTFSYKNYLVKMISVLLPDIFAVMKLLKMELKNRIGRV